MAPPPSSSNRAQELANKWKAETDARQSVNSRVNNFVSNRDYNNFAVEKRGRFSARGFQFVISLLNLVFLGQQDSNLLTFYGVRGAIMFSWIISLLSLLLSVILVLIYLMPIFKKSFTSIRILIFETAMDGTLIIGWMASFLAEVIPMGGNCPPFKSGSCDSFNWVLTWSFFSIVTAGAALWFDYCSIYSGLWSQPEPDPEIQFEVRRATRTGRH
ncbi:uncharacterized protein BJ171DRAFT_460089 [Polychytrium aggregatum]|uniref:uncharacterized protein n=1 Tax=Polychytrium aggregatum TaxID=110093 RepID=UPI0022FE3159|nr:uncharacterized protein BJ171DRAFT_460089 [Polychytrium aggregatum]KAI9203617.1 hypothetical protein BJ171DRAFT_460089 [Polychytrium aggregatum]